MKKLISLVGIVGCNEHDIFTEPTAIFNLEDDDYVIQAPVDNHQNFERQHQQNDKS